MQKESEKSERAHENQTLGTGDSTGCGSETLYSVRQAMQVSFYFFCFKEVRKKILLQDRNKIETAHENSHERDALQVQILREALHHASQRRRSREDAHRGKTARLQRLREGASRISNNKTESCAPVTSLGPVV